MKWKQYANHIWIPWSYEKIHEWGYCVLIQHSRNKSQLMLCIMQKSAFGCLRLEISDEACLWTRYAEQRRRVLRYLTPTPCRVMQVWRCRAAHKSWYRSASGQMSGCTREADLHQSARSSTTINEFSSIIWNIDKYHLRSIAIKLTFRSYCFYL